jgi:hypothetical protein
MAFGASTVILVVGAQKIVRNLDEAFRRIEDYCLPIEDQRALRIYGEHSGINTLLILNKERHSRTHVLLVREPLGYQRVWPKTSPGEASGTDPRLANTGEFAKAARGPQELTRRLTIGAASRS